MTTSPEPVRPDPAQRTRHVGLLSAAAILALLLDQGSKALALERLEPGVRIPVLGDLLAWRLVFNPGAAFSFGTGMTWVFTVVMAAVSIGVLLIATRIGSRWWALCVGALLGGAMGNLVDRLAREPGFGVGHVVDFIDYGYFIGNVADIAIVGSALIMVVLSLVGIGWEGKPAASGDAVDDVAEGEQADQGEQTDQSDQTDQSEQGAPALAESADQEPPGNG